MAEALRLPNLKLVQNEPPPSPERHSSKLDKWVAEIVTKLPLGDLQQRSSLRSGRLILKVASVAVLGTATALATDNLFLRGVGILFIAIAMSWADLIAAECRQVRFFPSNVANSIFGQCLRWEVVAVIFAGLYGLSVTGVTWLSLLDAAAVGQFWAVPFLLMRLNRYTMQQREKEQESGVRQRDIITCVLISKQRGPYLFPQMDEVLDMILASIDFKEKAPEASPSAEKAQAQIAQAISQAVEVPVYNLNQLSRSAADAVSQALGKVRFVREPSEVGSDDEDEIPIPDPKKFKKGISSLLLKRRGQPDSIQKHLLKFLTLPMRVLSREALLWERRDLPLYACMFTILTFIYFGYGEFSWLVLIGFSPLLGPKSKAAGALRDLQNEMGKMYQVETTDVDRKGNKIVRPPLWSVVSVPMVFYMWLIHSLGCLGLWAIVSPMSWSETIGIQAPSRFTLLFAFVLWPMTAFGITGGVHRLWAHRSYQANFPVRLVLMLLNSMANQGSIFHWARDHRVHHLYSDSEADPYNARRGFFFCHIGWMMVQKNKAVIEAGKKVDMSDLERDPVVTFQRRLDPFWNLAWCFLVPSVVCHLMGDHWMNGFLVAGVFRYVYVLHCTWFVNSLVHTVGESRPYDPSHPTRESAIVSFFAIGEGWHNWHHAYGWDYAAAELDWWRQYNPTKMVLDFLALFGAVWGRKRAHGHWERRRKRWEEHYGVDPVGGLRGVPPFQHREIDYEIFENSPREVADLQAKGEHVEFPTIPDEHSSKVKLQKAARTANCKCTKAGAARGVVSVSAACAVAAGAVVQGFANSYFGVSEYLCYTGFTIFAVLVAGRSFLRS